MRPKKRENRLRYPRVDSAVMSIYDSVKRFLHRSGGGAVDPLVDAGADAEEEGGAATLPSVSWRVPCRRCRWRETS